MEGKTAAIDQPNASQQTVTVPQDHNSLVVRLQGHTWVSVSTGAHQLVHNESPDPVDRLYTCARDLRCAYRR